MYITFFRRRTIGGLTVAPLLAGMIALGLSKLLPAED
jgi:hypothetical protein